MRCWPSFTPQTYKIWPKYWGHPAESAVAFGRVFQVLEPLIFEGCFFDDTA
jgi:hypothetical protein